MNWLVVLNRHNFEVKKRDLWKLLVLIFIVGALVGFLYEEVFYFFEDGFLSKRGFLYGPYLPVYGWGAVFLYIFLKPLKKHPVLVFLFAMIITGVLEYITGKVMFLIWQERWWDYTGLFGSIEGFVCLRSVISFAVGGIVLLYIVVPFLHRFLSNRNSKKIQIFCIIFLIIFLIDNFVRFFFPIY